MPRSRDTRFTYQKRYRPGVQGSPEFIRTGHVVAPEGQIHTTLRHAATDLIEDGILDRRENGIWTRYYYSTVRVLFKEEVKTP